MSTLGWLLLRWLINAGALLFVAHILVGVRVQGVGAALAAALVLGIVNAVIRPILVALTLPINLVTLGLFTFVLNAALLLLVAAVVEGFAIDGFASALVAAIILWAVSLVTNTLFDVRR